jgi:hypothetical protein
MIMIISTIEIHEVRHMKSLPLSGLVGMRGGRVMMSTSAGSKAIVRPMVTLRGRTEGEGGVGGECIVNI